MRIRNWFAIGAILLPATACGSPHGPEDSDGAHPAASLADAIRMARARADGWIAVAAGRESEAERDWEVALLSNGRVRELSVDVESGRVDLVKERTVREGHEEFAARLEGALPDATIDLARAVEIALANAPGARAAGVQVVPSGDSLAYEVTVVAGGEASSIRVDVATGELEER